MMALSQTTGRNPHAPDTLGRQEGPFREMDLLAIGLVLLVVMGILGVRWLLRNRR